jgi:hypothetical protein
MTIEEQYKEVRDQRRVKEQSWAPLALTFGERLDILNIQAFLMIRNQE